MIAECVINRLHVVEKKGRCREERTGRGLHCKTGGEWIKGPTWRLRSSECALVLFGELEAGTLLPQRTLHAPTIRARRVFDWRGELCMEGCWCTRPSPWCAVLHKHTQIHDNPLHRLSKAMNGGHSAYSPCKSGSQRDSVAAVIKESPLFRCLSTFQSFPTQLRHTWWTTSNQIWRQFEIFCMKSCKLQTAKGIK